MGTYPKVIIQRALVLLTGIVCGILVLRLWLGATAPQCSQVRNLGHSKERPIAQCT